MKWAALGFQIAGIICAFAAAMITFDRFSEVGFLHPLFAAFTRGLSLPFPFDFRFSSSKQARGRDQGLGADAASVQTQVTPLPSGQPSEQIAALHSALVQLSRDLDQVRSDGSATRASLGVVQADVVSKTQELAAGTIYLQIVGLVLIAIGTVLGTLV